LISAHNTYTELDLDRELVFFLRRMGEGSGLGLGNSFRRKLGDGEGSGFPPINLEHQNFIRQ